MGCASSRDSEDVLLDDVGSDGELGLGVDCNDMLSDSMWCYSPKL